MLQSLKKKKVIFTSIIQQQSVSLLSFILSLMKVFQHKQKLRIYLKGSNCNTKETDRGTLEQAQYVQTNSRSLQETTSNCILKKI